MKWNDGLKAKFACGADEKQIQAQLKKRKRLDILEDLNEAGGPFTSSEEVKEFLNGPFEGRPQKEETEKRAAIGKGKFCHSAQKTDQIFKIQVTLPSKKRRDKNARDLSESMMTYRGNFGKRKTQEFEKFQTTLVKILAAQKHS